MFTAPLQGSGVTLTNQDFYNVICPLEHDNVTGEGVASATVDFFDEIGTPRFAGTDLGMIQCWIAKCNNVGYCANGTPANATVTPTNGPSTMFSLAVSAPIVAGKSFANGGAAIYCKMQINMWLQGVRYSEPGGNSLDF
jgi:hypothetical protein